MKKTSFLLPIITMIISACSSSKPIQNDKTIENFEPEKYLGKWYEIARITNNFEKDLVGVTAEYSMLPNGLIKVLNSGYKHSLDGKKKSSEGKAKINPNCKSKLKVSFFLWFYVGDYWIIALDKDYQNALVGSSNENFLWILSRDKQMDENIYQNYIEVAKQRGYNIDKLIKVKQF